MATDLRKNGGLLVIGIVLGVAALSLSAGRNDPSPPLSSVPSGSRQPSTSLASRARLSQSSPTDRNSTDTNSDSDIDNQDKGEIDMSSSTNKSGQVEHAGDADFQQKVLDSSVPVLVDFYADWCGPCRMVAPVLEELAQELSNARIVKVNVDENPNVASQYKIQSIPALIVFQNGQPVSQHLGLASKSQLRSMLGL